MSPLSRLNIRLWLSYEVIKFYNFIIPIARKSIKCYKVFEDNPAMIKELKDKLHQTPRIKSDKPPFCF